MPKLYSRMDDISWVTPSVSDILDQGTAPPGGDGSIREQMLFLQRKLGELETPARVINVRPTPSYTLFIAKPEMIGDLSNRRPVTVNEIKRSLAHIAEEKKDWKFGFIPQLQEVSDAVGILLRTDQHMPLSLRRLLVHSTYRDYPSTLAFVIGNTLEQRIHIQDLSKTGNMLVIGSDINKQHFINSVLLTMITLNTPGEVRMAIAGQSSNTFKLLINTPHALGRLLTNPSDGIRLIDGLVTELEHRLQWFAEEEIDNIDSYNLILRERDKTQLPRIIMLIDSLSDPEWQNARSTWISSISKIVANKGKAGIHMFLTAGQMKEPDIPAEISEHIEMFVITKSAAGDYMNRVQNFHGSLVRFIDALVINGNDEEIIPVELCTVSQEEVERAVLFWQQITEQRKRETQKSLVSGKTGVTGALQYPDDSEKIRLSPRSPSTETTETVTVPAVVSAVPIETDAVNLKAQALAAYLGWIGTGPLQDILGMTAEEAQEAIKSMQAAGIIESGNSLTPRFVKLIGKSPKE